MNENTKKLYELCDKLGFEVNELIADEMAFDILAVLAKEIDDMRLEQHHEYYATKRLLFKADELAKISVVILNYYVVPILESVIDLEEDNSQLSKECTKALNQIDRYMLHLKEYQNAKKKEGK